MKFRRLLFYSGLFILKAIGKLPGRRYGGKALGLLTYSVYRSRRCVVQNNLRIAMPELSDAQRNTVMRNHFIGLGKMVFDMLWALSASEEDIKNFIKMEGHLPSSCILMAPHFLGMELALLRISIDVKPNYMGYHYRRLKNNFWDEVIDKLRSRFDAVGFDRLQKNSLLKLVRHCKKGNVVTYSPDIAPSKHAKDTMIVPFMGEQQVATTGSIIRLKKMANAPLVPLIIQQRANGYVLKFLPPMDEDLCNDMKAAVIRMNEIIGEGIAKKPENYYWLHRRFK